MKKFSIGGFIVISVSTFVLTACGGSANSSSEPTSTSIPEASPTRIAATPTIQVPPDDRLRIPSIGVDAPLSVKPVQKDGALPANNSPDDVVLYDFSQNWPTLGGSPGSGNTVVNGKLDSGSIPCKNGTVPAPCKAVFWDLNQVKKGAQILLFMKQQAYVYTVSIVCSISNSGQFDPALQKTATERLTLTTATGTFQGQGYSHTLLVIAERGQNTITECPQGTLPGLPTVQSRTP